MAIQMMQVDIHEQFKMAAKLQDGCQNKGFLIEMHAYV